MWECLRFHNMLMPLLLPSSIVMKDSSWGKVLSFSGAWHFRDALYSRGIHGVEHVVFPCGSAVQVPCEGGSPVNRALEDRELGKTWDPIYLIDGNTRLLLENNYPLWDLIHSPVLLDNLVTSKQIGSHPLPASCYQNLIPTASWIAQHSTAGYGVGSQYKTGWRLPASYQWGPLYMYKAKASRIWAEWVEAQFQLRTSPSPYFDLDESSRESLKLLHIFRHTPIPLTKGCCRHLVTGNRSSVMRSMSI